ncbi:MAG: glycosyltransferase family 2 protein [Acidimicrobiales bacterium]
MKAITEGLHDVELRRDRFISGPPNTVAVVVCAYTERRWNSLLSAIASLRAQRRPPDQCLVVIDHNPQLLRRARSALGSDIDVLASIDPRGLSGARNAGVRHAKCDVVAFLDDDAEADPGWLEELLAQYRPHVAGAGGVAVPVWPERDRPRWFPPEFDWVVGCSYRGLPNIVTPQRNLLGTTMSFRRSVFDRVGSFDTALGRLGSVPLGCEETEFALRLQRILVGAQLLHVPPAVVRHHVAAERATVPYFLRRCYAEGISKAAVAQRAGGEQALSSERRYVLSTLPRGVADGLCAGFRGDLGGFARSAMVCIGLITTIVGYLVGRREVVCT